MKFKIGRFYNTYDGYRAKVIGRLSDGRLIIQVGDHINITEPNGRIKPRMICNYVTDGRCAYDLVEE